jgi:flagellar biogenesis protein FliO
MIFIIGYIFGGFSRKPVLATLSKIAAILAIVLFISANILLMRFAFGHGCHRYQQQEINRPAH